MADSREGDYLLSKALMAVGRGDVGEVAASKRSVGMEWSRGPGWGWGLRRRVRRAKRQLEAQGFDVTTCVVGRKYRLIRRGALPRNLEAEQDRLGLAAVLKAHRRKARPDPGSPAATPD